MARRAGRLSEALGLLLLTAAGLAGRAEAAGVDAAFLADTRQYFSRLEKLGFAGVLVVAQDGEPLLAEGYGLADRERRIPWTPATVASLGSITKGFTAAAILRLEAKGALRVSDPIDRYLPGVPEDKRAITLHQLLTHSSGIVDLEGADDFDPLERDEFVRRALAQKLAFPPGSRYEYSNAGYSLLGAIVERVGGKSYERFLRDELLLPSGLYETGYVLPRWGDGRFAQGYSPAAPSGRWGTILERPMAADGPYWVLRANGGIHTTAYDLLRWAQAWLDGRLLPTAERDKAWTGHVSEGGDSAYGYGWSIRTLPGGIQAVTHNGSNGIFFADLAILPASRLVVFLSTNVRAELPLTSSLLGAVGRRWAGAPYPSLPEVVERPAAELAAVAGSYAATGPAGEGTVEVRPDGGALRLMPHGRTAFARLHSTRPLDLARSERLSRQTDEILAAFAKGDIGPMYQAFGGEVPRERLRELWGGRLREIEARQGAFEGYEVLGTALATGRDVTVVRLRFTRGTAERALVWSPDGAERLQGISSRELRPDLRSFPVAGGGFASFDPVTGDSRPLRFAPDAQGRLRLRFGDGAFEGIRKKTAAARRRRG